MATEQQPMELPPLKQPNDKYIVTVRYEARSKGRTKIFEVDSVVEGRDNVPPPNVKMMPSIITSDDYMLPKSILRTMPVVELPEETDLLGKGKDIVENKAFKNGAMYGVIAGAGYGFFKNKNIFYSAIIGMVAGGALSYFFKNKNKK